MTLPQLTAPRETRVRPPVGYYRSLNQGEQATIASIEEPDSLESNTHYALATVEPEPILKEALNGPDVSEWQDAINYEIGQLEKLGAWEIVNPPSNVNIIPCHFVLATK